METNWIKENWKILTFIVMATATVVGFSIGLKDVQARVTNLENINAKYPTQEWFSLKFDTIKDQYVQMRADIKENRTNCLDCNCEK